MHLVHIHRHIGAVRGCSFTLVAERVDASTSRTRWRPRTRQVSSGRRSRRSGSRSSNSNRKINRKINHMRGGQAPAQARRAHPGGPVQPPETSIHQGRPSPGRTRPRLRASDRNDKTAANNEKFRPFPTGHRPSGSEATELDAENKNDDNSGMKVKTPGLPEQTRGDKDDANNNKGVAMNSDVSNNKGVATINDVNNNNKGVAMINDANKDNKGVVTINDENSINNHGVAMIKGATRHNNNKVGEAISGVDKNNTEQRGEGD